MCHILLQRIYHHPFKRQIEQDIIPSIHGVTDSPNQSPMLLKACRLHPPNITRNNGDLWSTIPSRPIFGEFESNYICSGESIRKSRMPIIVCIVPTSICRIVIITVQKRTKISQASSSLDWLIGSVLSVFTGYLVINCVSVGWCGHQTHHLDLYTDTCFELMTSAICPKYIRE